MGKNIIKKVVAGVMALATILSSVNFTLTVNSEELNDIESTCWMKELDDDLMLSQITIPGTHDSGTKHVELGYVMRCQNTTIAKQLKNGYRYIDLRLRINEKENKDGSVEKTLIIVHNFASCHVSANPFSEKLKFTDVTADIYEFLEANPSEAVIVNCKIEDDDHSISEVQEFLEKEISDNRQYWNTESEIARLGDVRGKISLFTRFDDEAGYDDNGLTLKWSEQNNNKPIDIPYELYVFENCRLWVQDRYKYKVEDKYEAVIDGLENCEADENTIFLNFVSTAGSGKIGHPKGYAKQLNKLLLAYDLHSGTSYGIIIVDFGSAKLAKHLYMTNF